MKKIILILTLIYLLSSCEDNTLNKKLLDSSSGNLSNLVDMNGEQVEYLPDIQNTPINKESWDYNPGKLVNLLEINIDNFQVKDISQIISSTEGPYDLHIGGWGTKISNNKISSIFKSLTLKSIDVQYLDDYDDKNYYVLNNLDTSKIESIRLVFYGIDKEQGLEKTLQILKEKINNSPNLENFKYLSLDIGNYRFSKKELEIISQIKVKHFGYNDDEELIPERLIPKVTAKEIEQRRKNIEVGIREEYIENPIHSKSDDIVKKLLLDSPHLEEILYGDYRWFRKENGKIIYSE